MSPAPSYQLESADVPETSALPVMIAHCPVVSSVYVREPVLLHSWSYVVPVEPVVLALLSAKATE